MKKNSYGKWINWLKNHIIPVYDTFLTRRINQIKRGLFSGKYTV